MKPIAYFSYQPMTAALQVDFKRKCSESHCSEITIKVVIHV